MDSIELSRIQCADFIRTCYSQDTDTLSCTSHVDYINNKLTIRNVNFDTCLFVCEEHGEIRIGENVLSYNNLEQIEFDNCEFARNPIISHLSIWNVKFTKCNFNSSDGNMAKDLLQQNSDNSKRVQFIECKFETFKLGDITDIMYNQNISFCRFDLYGGSVENLTIQNIDLASKVYINRQSQKNNRITEIAKLSINNSVFQQNFKLHHCNIKEAKIEDSDFEQQADFYKSIFNESVVLKSLNFKGLTIFGNCIFHEKITFKSVTFEEFVHFKEAKFHKGLDLDYANFQKELHFFASTGLDSKDSKNNTSRETYRIIKNSFLEVSNQIDANNFLSLELEKFCMDTKDKLSNKKDKIKNRIKYLPDFIIPFLHCLSSDFNRSWLLALIWIICVGIITTLSLSWQDPKIACSLSEIFKHISIFNIDKKIIESYPITSFFNKVSLGYLYYQAITAMRKNAKL